MLKKKKTLEEYLYRASYRILDQIIRSDRKISSVSVIEWYLRAKHKYQKSCT